MARRILILLLATACAAAAYSRRANSIGSTVRRADITNMVFEINDQFVAGLQNADGQTLITPDSDPVDALIQAFEAWDAIPDSTIRFASVNVTSNPLDPADGRHSVGAPDDSNIRALVGDAVAVTFFFTNQSGVIVDSDIYFNPSSIGPNGFNPFSTTNAPDSWPILPVVLHELGHALGAAHSGVLGATMYQSGRLNEHFAGTLEFDDIAFAIDAYPSPSGTPGWGRIRGTASLAGGDPIRGGLVEASDPATGIVVGGITSTADGSFNFVVPAGRYVVYVEPLDGPVRPANLNLPNSSVTEDFQTALAGDEAVVAAAAGSPAVFGVVGGAETVVNLTAEPDAPALNIAFLGIASGGSIAVGTGPRELTADKAHEIFLWGPGIDQVQEGEIEVLGPSFTVKPGSVSTANIPFQGFNQALAFFVDVPRDAPVLPPGRPGGELGTILIQRDGLATAYTGAFVLEPGEGPRPAFTSQSMINAASFVGPATSGSLASLFVSLAEVIGPGGGVAQALPLPLDLAATRVEFFPGAAIGEEGKPGVPQGAGIPAPLIFVSGAGNQINLQIPWEVPPGQTPTVVTANGRSSDPVLLTVANVVPGIFSFDFGGGKAVAFYNDGALVHPPGTLGKPSRPAAVGEAFSILVAGLGPTNPPANTNANSYDNGVFVQRNTVFIPAVTIGGVPAQLLGSLLSPEFIGVYQVVVVPQPGTPAGAAVPIVVTSAGVASRGDVTVAIAP